MIITGFSIRGSTSLSKGHQAHARRENVSRFLAPITRAVTLQTSAPLEAADVNKQLARLKNPGGK
jgi:hypothetical protein